MTWNLLNFTSARTNASAKLAETKVPAEAQAYILSEINGLPQEFGIVSINGFGQDVKSPMQPHRLTRNIQLTITGSSI